MLTGPGLAWTRLMKTQSPYPSPTIPPFCPNPKCRFHALQSDPWPLSRFGIYTRQRPPHTVQRYRCNECGRTFSDQTFKSTYWLKHPEHLLQIQKHAVSGASNRQIARIIGCAPSTVDNQLARLGRHSILFHRHMMKKASPFVDVVVDGLVTFEYSQYFPYELVAAADRESSFVIHFAEAERRRSGTMTPYQKMKRQFLESVHLRADPQSVMKAMVEVLSVSLAGAIKAQVWSDKHKTYPFAIRRIRFCEIEHHTIDSRRKRTTRNPLFEINCLDMLIRHCLKDHTRETIAFGKRRQHSVYRMAIFLVWRNYIKMRREKRCRMTPAMLVGLTNRPLREEDILSRRLFVKQIELPQLWADYYWRRIRTRALPVNRGHELAYAA